MEIRIGIIIPTEGVLNSRVTIALTPHGQVLNRTSPCIAVAAHNHLTDRLAISVNHKGHIIRPNRIIIITVVPIDRKIKPDRLIERHRHRLAAGNRLLLCVLIHISNLDCPHDTATITIGRQVFPCISPCVLIAVLSVGLREHTLVIQFTVRQKLNHHAIAVGTITPCIGIIQPHQVHRKVLSGLVCILLIIPMGQSRIHTVLFTGHNRGIIRLNRRIIHRCPIVQICGTTIRVNKVGRQTLNRVNPH